MPSEIDSVMLALIFGLIGLVGLGLVALFVRQKKELGAVRTALQGSSGESLEQLLIDHTRGRIRLEEANEELRSRVAALERDALEQVGRVGLVRYNAFEEVGGDQSFAVAFQNAQGSGVVLNTLTGRQQVKIYCKLLKDGRSAHPLTPEEEAAIALAARSPVESEDL